MIHIKSVSKSQLNGLPVNVFRLIGLGKYTLYEVSDSENPQVFYALRTGAQEIFLLSENGEPLDRVPQAQGNFKIKGKVDIQDVPVIASVPNLCF